MKNRGWSSCVPFPRRSRHVISPRPWKAGKLYPQDWIPIDAKKFEFFFNLCERRMKNSLRDLLDQLEWTNFFRVPTKDSVEKFEQVQILYCFIQLSFHYSHRAKEGRNNEWKFPFQTRLEEIRISIDRKKLQLLRTTNGKFSSLFFRLDNLNGQIFAKFRSTKDSVEKFDVHSVHSTFITRLLSSSEKTKE